MALGLLSVGRISGTGDKLTLWWCLGEALPEVSLFFGVEDFSVRDFGFASDAMIDSGVGAKVWSASFVVFFEDLLDCILLF